MTARLSLDAVGRSVTRRPSQHAKGPPQMSLFEELARRAALPDSTGTAADIPAPGIDAYGEFCRPALAFDKDFALALHTHRDRDLRLSTEAKSVRRLCMRGTSRSS